MKPYPNEELERMSKREIIRLYKRAVEQCNDAVPVIRCRDCKYAKKIYLKNLPWLKQWEYSCQYFNTHSVMGDGYCNNAERKEKDETD